MKSIYKEALEIFKNRVSKLHINHKIGNKDIAKLEILDIAKAIETHVTPIFEQALTELEQAQKQEELLDLYRELDDCIVAPTGHHVCRYTDDEKYARIRKQIKELEK